MWIWFVSCWLIDSVVNRKVDCGPDVSCIGLIPKWQTVMDLPFLPHELLWDIGTVWSFVRMNDIRRYGGFFQASAVLNGRWRVGWLDIEFTCVQLCSVDFRVKKVISNTCAELVVYRGNRNWWIMLFLRASAMLKHVIDIGWTSVCLSVCHTLVLYQNGWTYCHAFFTTREPIHSSFVCIKMFAKFQRGPLNRVGVWKCRNFRNNLLYLRNGWR